MVGIRGWRRMLGGVSNFRPFPSTPPWKKCLLEFPGFCLPGDTFTSAQVQSRGSLYALCSLTNATGLVFHVHSFF